MVVYINSIREELCLLMVHVQPDILDEMSLVKIKLEAIILF